MGIFMVSKMVSALGTMEAIGLLESNTKEFKVVSLNNITHAILNGTKIENLAVKNYDIIATNGRFNRYASFKDNINNLIGDSPIVILNEIVDGGVTVGFEASDYKGVVLKLKYNDAVKYAKKNGIANGRLVDIIGGSYISSINGSYNKIDIKDLENKRLAKYKALYDTVEPFKNGRATIKLGNKIGVIDSNYNIIVPAKYIRIDTIDVQGTQQLMVSDGKNYGIFKMTGEAVLEPKYSYINRGNDKYLVKIEGLGCGCTDNEGNELIPLIYEDMDRVSVNSIIVTKNKLKGCIDFIGNVVMPLVYDEINRAGYNVLTVTKNELKGYMDYRGNKLTDIIFEDAKEFNNGKAPVKIKGKWGFIDKTYKFVVEPKYEGYGLFRDDRAAVMLNNKWGFVSNTGREVTDIKYDGVRGFESGLAAVMLNNKWGFIDKLGIPQVPIMFDSVGDFEDGTTYAMFNGTQQKIDCAGKIVKERNTSWGRR